MKTVQLVPAMEQGGVERGIVEMNHALSSAGIDNLVISAGGRLADKITADGGRHLTLDLKSKNPFTYFFRAEKLRKILDAEDPDVVVAHSRVPAWLFVCANRFARRPWIGFAHGANSISFYSRIMTAGDLTVTPSRYIADYLKKAYGLAEEKLRVIPRAVDRAKFDPDHLDCSFMEAKRREWGLDGKYVVMGVGRITQLKGYDTLIRASACAAEEIHNLRTVIVGEAEASRKDVEDSLRTLVKDLGMEDRVVFAGNQSKIAECLALSNVVVSANTHKPEAFGRSMMEALAMNRPVIATAFGGALDIVKDPVNGAFVSPGTERPEEGFAAALIRVSKTRFGDLRQPIIEKFAFDRMITQSLIVYRSFDRRKTDHASSSR